MSSSPVTPRAERTRAEVLDVAWKLVADRGVDVSMAEVAAACGLSRQSLYLHFGSRGGLLVALVRRADERADIHGRFLAALTRGDPGARLDACLRAWLDFVPAIHPVASALLRSRGADPEAAHAWQDRMQELRDGFGLLSRSLRADGALARGLSAPAAADALWAGSSVQAWELLAVECGWGHPRAARFLRRSLARVVLREPRL